MDFVFIILMVLLEKECIYASEKLVCVKAYDTVTLECPRLEENQVWRGPGSQLYSIGTKVHTKLGIKDRLKVVEVMSPPQLNLQIKNFTLDDQGHYQCLRGDQVLHNDDFLVQIAKYSTELTIKNEEEDNTVRGFINKTLELNCTVTVENFAVILKWETNNRTLLFDAEEFVVYRFRPQLDDHLNIFTCIAKYNCTAKPFTKSVKIFLYLKPKVEIREGSEIEVLEGSKLMLECNYSSNHNIRGLSWKYSKTVDGFQEVISVENAFFNFNNITRNHSGKYVCLVENMAGFTTAEILVSVKYQPTVYIISNATSSGGILKCIPNGNPDNYTFYKWKYMSNYMEHIRYLDGDQSGTLILERRKEHKSRHNGVYVCRVSNGISVNGNQIVSTKYVLNYTGKPYFITSNNDTQYGRIEQMMTMFADVVIDPNDKAKITVMNSSMLPMRVSYKEMPVKTYDTVYGKNITVDATRVSICFELKDKDAFQAYTILAMNNYGSSNFTVNVKPASSPKPPMILKTSARQTEVLINWQPSFDGGFTQTFYIQYRKTTVSKWTDVAVGNKTSTILYGLEPNTEYYIQMFSQNKLGRSIRSEQYMFRTESKSIHAIHSMNYVVPLLIVFVIVAVITFLQSRKGCTRTKFKDVITFRCLQPSDDRAEDGNNGDFGAVENDVYIIGNHNSNRSINEPEIPVYSSIERGARLRTEDNMAYSVAFGRSKLHENSEEQVTKDEAPSLAKRAVNQTSDKDSINLNYVQICFDKKPKNYKFCIHGSENRTPYAEIDFTQTAPCLSSSDDEDSDGDFEDMRDIEMTTTPS